MTLGFSTHINGKPTFFVEMILASLADNIEGFQIPEDFTEFDWNRYYNCIEAKHHTIRKDEKDRWKAGRDIHMVIHNRTPQRTQFAPVVKCKSTQEIVIKHSSPIQRGKKHIEKAIVWIDGEASECIWINKQIKHCDQTIKFLASGDGFSSVEDFFQYFKEDFSGKIIHWTHLKY